MSTNLVSQIKDLNEQLANLVGYSITDNTLPKVEAIKRKGLLGRLFDKIRGYDKAAGADRKTRTITLEENPLDWHVVHELTHILHWDLQDEKGIKEAPGDYRSLIRQAWEEGVAVFVELEYMARTLMEMRQMLASDSEIAQERMNIFRDYYKQGQSFDQALKRFTNLCRAFDRMERYESASKEEKKILGYKELVSDIAQMMTSKEVIYDVGYRIVIDTTRHLLGIGYTQQEAILWVMEHPPQILDEMYDYRIYLSQQMF